MRKAFLYMAYLAVIGVGCTTINNLEPNQTETFLKIYGETNQMESKDLAVLSDGFLILSTYSETSTLLLKTDPNGNKIWAQSLDNFQGSSLAIASDGYIIIGDRIKGQDSTYMMLIKTSTNDGSVISSIELGNVFYHGSAVTINASNEVIALGYTSDSILLNAYDINLVDSTLWTTPRKYKAALPSKSIYETTNANLTWLSYSSDVITNSTLNFTEVPPDSEGPEQNSPLFIGSSFSNTNGDLVKTPVGYAITQTVKVTNETKIGFSDGFNETVLLDGFFANGNFTSASITNSTNGLLIVASYEVASSSRTDKDLLLIELNYNGTIKTEGINQTFGGNGNEIPTRIRKTNDGGYAILGNLINTKGAKQTFLLKTNSKGSLN